jgi:hypothetical protein
MWDARSGPRQLGILRWSGSPLREVVYSDDPHSLAAACDDGKIRLWADVTASDEAVVLKGGHHGEVTALAFSPLPSAVSGRKPGFVASTAHDGTVLLHPLPAMSLEGALSGEEMTARRLLQHHASLTAVAFQPGDDEGLLVATSEDGIVIVYDLRQHQVVARLTGHTGPVTGVAFAPSGKGFATASKDGTLRFWRVTELKTGAAPMVTLVNLADGQWAILSPDGRFNPFLRRGREQCPDAVWCDRPAAADRARRRLVRRTENVRIGSSDSPEGGDQRRPGTPSVVDTEDEVGHRRDKTRRERPAPDRPAVDAGVA